MCIYKGFLFVATALLVLQSCRAQDAATLKKIRECLGKNGSLVCLKERALDILNDTIMSDKPMSLYGIVDVVRDPNYNPYYSPDENFLPGDIQERSIKLNDMLYDKIMEYFTSRTIKINLGNMVEGRGKKNKHKGGMLMMGGLAMAGMMAQMFMGKIAFMAGAALLLAKIALMLSTVIGFKKLSGGSGGGDVALRNSLLLLGGLAMGGVLVKKFVGLAGFFKMTSAIAFLKIFFAVFMSYMTNGKKFAMTDYF